MNRYTNTENNIASTIPHRLPKNDDTAIETAVLSHRLFLYFRIILSLNIYIIIKRLRCSTRLTVSERQSLFCSIFSPAAIFCTFYGAFRKIIPLRNPSCSSYFSCCCHQRRQRALRTQQVRLHLLLQPLPPCSALQQ